MPGFKQIPGDGAAQSDQQVRYPSALQPRSITGRKMSLVTARQRRSSARQLGDAKVDVRRLPRLSGDQAATVS